MTQQGAVLVQVDAGAELDRWAGLGEPPQEAALPVPDRATAGAVETHPGSALGLLCLVETFTGNADLVVRLPGQERQRHQHRRAGSWAGGAHDDVNVCLARAEPQPVQRTGPCQRDRERPYWTVEGVLEHAGAGGGVADVDRAARSPAACVGQLDIERCALRNGSARRPREQPHQAGPDSGASSGCGPGRRGAAATVAPAPSATAAVSTAGSMRAAVRPTCCPSQPMSAGPESRPT